MTNQTTRKMIVGDITQLVWENEPPLNAKIGDRWQDDGAGWCWQYDGKYWVLSDSGFDREVAEIVSP